MMNNKQQPHRVRMAHSLVVYYWLYRNMEVRASANSLRRALD